MTKLVDPALSGYSALEAVRLAARIGFTSGEMLARIALCATKLKTCKDSARMELLEAMRLATSAGYEHAEAEAEALIMLAELDRDEKRYDSAAARLQRATGIAKLLDDYSLLLDARTGTAVLYAHMGQDSLAFESCRHTIALCLQHKDRQAMIRLAADLSSTFDRMRKPGNTEHVFDLCVSQCEDRRDTSALMAALWMRGDWHFAHRDIQRSLAYSLRCTELRGDDYADRYLVFALNNVGRAMSISDRISEAVDYYTRALNLCDKVGGEIKDYFSATLLYNLATTWMELGDNARGLEYFHRCVRVLEDFGDEDGLEGAYHALGLYYVRIKDYVAAAAYFHLRAMLARHRGDFGTLAQSYSYLGQTMNAQSKYPEALSYYDSSIVAYTKTDNHKEAGAVMGRRGEALMKLQRHEEAIRSFHDGIDLKRQTDDFAGEAELLAKLGMAELDLGQYDEALTHLSAAMKIESEHGYTVRLAKNLENIADIRLGMRDTAEALLFLDSVMTVERKSEVKSRSKQLLARLIPLREAHGDFEKAYRLQLEFGVLKDTLLTHENRKQVNLLKVRFETERKEKQIALLEKDRKVRELELDERDRELERRRLEAVRRARQIELLKRDGEIHKLKLTGAETEMELRTTAIKRNRAENAARQRELDLQAATAEREHLIGGAAATGSLLLFAVAALALRSMRYRRRTAALKAEAAELKARAAEAMALKQRGEAERKETQARKEFTRRLIGAQEVERKRIAGSLHDGIGQDLLIIKHRAMMALDDQEEAKEHLRDILEVATEAIDDVRGLTADLRPVQLERLGLTATLRAMLSSVSKSTQMEMDADIEDVDGMIAPEREIDLYRIVQEAVNNIVKHAGAARATVRLKRVNGSLLLKVRDDGRGFHTDESVSVAGSSGLGLRSISERVRMLGGRLKLESSVGQGTLIEAELPGVGTGNRVLGTGYWEPGTGNRGLGTGDWEPGTGNRGQGARVMV